MVDDGELIKIVYSMIDVQQKNPKQILGQFVAKANTSNFQAKQQLMVVASKRHTSQTKQNRAYLAHTIIFEALFIRQRSGKCTDAVTSIINYTK